MERILEGDAERGQPGIAFQVSGLRSDMSDVKNTMQTMTGVLAKLHLERAKLIGASLAIWSIGGLFGWLFSNFFHSAK